MIFKFRVRLHGQEHVRVTVFVAPGWDCTFQMTGQLTMTPAQWHRFQRVIDTSTDGSIIAMFEFQTGGGEIFACDGELKQIDGPPLQKI